MIHRLETSKLRNVAKCVVVAWRAWCWVFGGGGVVGGVPSSRARVGPSAARDAARLGSPLVVAVVAGFNVSECVAVTMGGLRAAAVTMGFSARVGWRASFPRLPPLPSSLPPRPP